MRRRLKLSTFAVLCEGHNTRNEVIKKHVNLTKGGVVSYCDANVHMLPAHSMSKPTNHKVIYRHRAEHGMVWLKGGRPDKCHLVNLTSFDCGG